ncbi:MAG TPA: DUF5989 family protein [Chitinophagaceae bacterium]|nr:DUF5989 family protein [Chitinophagaceae bacterium]
MSFAGDAWKYMRTRRKWWLFPVIIILLLLGSVSAFVILTLIFFVVIVPLSFIARITGKKFLILERQRKSYLRKRDFLYDKESMENVW